MNKILKKQSFFTVALLLSSTFGTLMGQHHDPPTYCIGSAGVCQEVTQIDPSTGEETIYKVAGREFFLLPR